MTVLKNVLTNVIVKCQEICIDCEIKNASDEEK